MRASSSVVGWYREALACPDCQSSFGGVEPALACTSCGFELDLSGTPIDLRPRNPRPCPMEFARAFDPEATLSPLSFARPKLTFDGPRAVRDSRELFSALQQVRPDGGDLLDLGCGPRDQAGPANYCGYRYVGLDLFSNSADIRGDAHAIPFAESTFDVVFSYAVLEHLHNPFLALAEVRRVLRPGGIFVGTVSQGEPFHSSYLHHTPWGLASVAAASELTIEMLWPSRDTLTALSEMGHYSRPVRWGLRALGVVERRLPFLAPRRWLQWSELQRRWDDSVRCGSLGFVLRREQALVEGP